MPSDGTVGEVEGWVATALSYKFMGATDDLEGEIRSYFSPYHTLVMDGFGH